MNLNIIKGDFADTNKMLKADSKYLADLHTECDVKSKEFDQRQKLRGEEVEALGQAIDILGGKPVAGSADKHLPSLLQSKKRSSFLQMKSSSAAVEKVVQYLRKQGKQQHSSHLMLLAVRVANNPFAKITKMIEAMITKRISIDQSY